MNKSQQEGSAIKDKISLHSAMRKKRRGQDDLMEEQSSFVSMPSLKADRSKMGSLLGKKAI